MLQSVFIRSLLIELGDPVRSCTGGTGTGVSCQGAGRAGTLLRWLCLCRGKDGSVRLQPNGSQTIQLPLVSCWSCITGSSIVIPNLVVFQDRKRCKKGTFGHIAEPEGEDVGELAQGNTAISVGKMLILLAQ